MSNLSDGTLDEASNEELKSGLEQDLKLDEDVLDEEMDHPLEEALLEVLGPSSSSGQEKDCDGDVSTVSNTTNHKAKKRSHGRKKINTRRNH